LISEKREFIKTIKERQPLVEIQKKINVIEKRPFFMEFCKRGIGTAKIIAEIKKASPSMGVLTDNLDIKATVKAYEHGGARAISVVTEEKYFKGDIAYVEKVKDITTLPILRKDFIIDEYEIFQSKAFGADAMLLIGETLKREELKAYLEIAEEIDIDVLLEIHSLKTYEKVSDFKGYILGINNRDLETLKVNINTSLELLKYIPFDVPVVIESGIEKRDDIERFEGYGVSGFLIGTVLMLSKDPTDKIRELRGKS